MARVSKKKEGAALPLLEAKVSAVEVEARNLLLFDSEHPIWKGKWKPKGVEGAIVRLRPAPGTPDEEVEEARALIEKAGAIRIKLEVRRGAALPTEAVQKAKPATRTSAREVVLGLMREANSADPAALSETIERVMAEEGL